MRYLTNLNKKETWRQAGLRVGLFYFSCELMRKVRNIQAAADPCSAVMKGKRAS